MRKHRLLYIFSLICLTSCSDVKVNDTEVPQSAEQQRKRGFGKLFGEDTFSLGAKSKTDDDVSGIGVNIYLWHASLDALSFMPLSSADPFGGVIITNWYSPPQTPGERYKIDVIILSRQLRSDGLRLTAFKQIMDDTNAWVDAPVEDQMAQKLEEAILLRARQLRIGSDNA